MTSIALSPPLPDARPVLVYLAMQTESGRRSQASALTRIASMLGTVPALLDWATIRYETLQALKARMVQERLKPATINRHLSAVRGVAKEAWRMKLLGTDDFTRLCDVANEPNRMLPAGRALVPSELRSVLAALDGPRARAIFGVLLCGLRRSEACQLGAGDVSEAGLRVLGKGRKERIVPYVAGTRELIAEWPGNFSITSDGIYKMLVAAAKRAGVERFRPHDLRRTFCTLALDAGIGIDLVAHAVGHASVDTTRRYDRSKDARTASAINSLQLL